MFFFLVLGGFDLLSVFVLVHGGFDLVDGCFVLAVEVLSWHVVV